MCFLCWSASLLKSHLDCTRSSGNHFFLSTVWDELQDKWHFIHVLQGVLLESRPIYLLKKWWRNADSFLYMPSANSLIHFLPFCPSIPPSLSSSVCTPTCLPLFSRRQCGFFQRAHYKDKLPQYHAVKIPREDRPQFQTEKSGVVHKKEWATHWSDGTL